MNKELVLKNDIKQLIVEMKEGEQLFQRKGDDLFAKGQLASTQYYRVKLEALLEEFGHHRPQTLIEG